MSNEQSMLRSSESHVLAAERVLKATGKAAKVTILEPELEMGGDFYSLGELPSSLEEVEHQSSILEPRLEIGRGLMGNAVTLATVNCICLASSGVAMKSGNIMYVYITYTIFGFFLQAYYATGIQMGIELTFPVPEGITVAMMSTGIELVSMFSASVLGVSVRRYGDFISTMVLTFLSFLSTIIVCLVPGRFRREELERAAKSVELKEFLPNPEKNKYIT